MKRIFFVLLSLIAVPCFGRYHKIMQFLPSNGLPSTTVYQAVEDLNGFMWFATDAGLSRFDGQSFTNFTVRDGLPDNEILYMRVDSQNRIWLGAFNKVVSYYDSRRQRIISDKNDTAIKTHTPLSFWGRHKHVPKIQPIHQTFNVYHIRVVADELYYATENGIYIFSQDSVLRDSLLTGVSIYDVCCDHQGNKWYASGHDGVYCELKSSGIIYNTAAGLSSDNILSVYADRDGRIFAGNDKGYIDVIEHGKVARNINLDIEKHIYCSVRSIDRSHDDRLMVITDAGMLTSDSRNYYNLHRWPGLPPGEIGALTKSFAESADGTIYALGGHGLLTIWDNVRQKVITEFNRRITATFIDRKGRIWFGALDGLHMLDDAQDTSSTYHTDDKILHNVISCIAGTAGGALWVASNSYGLAVIQPNGRILSISENNGLACDIVRKIYIDELHENAWIATYKGLCKIRYKQYGDSIAIENIYTYTAGSGLAVNTVNDVCVKNDTVYAATSEGLCVFADLPRQQVIPLFFTKVKVRYNEYPVSDSYTLSYLDDDISVSFSGICYSSNGHVRYWYRMLSDQTDTLWRTTTENTIDFAGLAPGSYKFEVKTDGGLPHTIRFFIRPPFWKTWWFYGLAALFFAGVVIIIAMRRVQIIKKETQKREETVRQIADMELRLLQSQLNPHFIFNVLNSIQMYINVMDRKRANEYLVKVSRLMRMFLDASRQPFTTVQHEMEMLSLYCALEKLRFENRFNYTISSNKFAEVQQAYFPSMLTQPFVENAINHGLLGKKEAGLLQIHFEAQGDRLVCTIEDNGVGRAAAGQSKDAGREYRKSWGMRLSAERMEVLNKINHNSVALEITDKTDASGNATGTLVTITVPLAFQRKKHKHDEGNYC
ncbi:sensor histidine kinase [Taibaiella soli]|uniref:sensor histidine kinase n=1 Tax=Taibaiella soli TaxID=1649169 RepID=UPI0014029BC7|nr:histidine kinase [Taibaiella soli]